MAQETRPKATALVEVRVEVDLAQPWPADTTVAQIKQQATDEAVRAVASVIKRDPAMKIVGTPLVRFVISAVLLFVVLACSGGDFRSRDQETAGASGSPISDAGSAGTSPEYSRDAGSAGASQSSSSDGGAAGGPSSAPGGDGGRGGDLFTPQGGIGAQGGEAFTAGGPSSGAGGDGAQSSAAAGDGGSSGDEGDGGAGGSGALSSGAAGNAGSAADGGAAGGLPGTGGAPPNPCSGLCEAEGALETGALSFDGIGRGYLYPPTGSSCLELGPADLGYSISGWNCQGFASGRSLSVNGIDYPGCSGASLYQLPPGPAQRNGGWCFETGAGQGAAVVAFF